MTDAPSLSSELTSLLGALPRGQLIEITRRAALGAYQATCRGLLGDAPLENILKAIFPEFQDRQIDSIANEIALCAIRNASWNNLLSLPGQWEVQIRCVDPASAQALRERKGPVIVTFWHHGATHVISLGLHSIGVPALIVGGRQPGWFHQSGLPEMGTVPSNDARKAAIALKASLDHLRKGGVVAVSPDGSHGKHDALVPLFGHPLPVARGMAVLARLTGAPIVPVLATWGHKDWSIDFRVFDPLPVPPIASMKPDDWEHEVTLIAMRRFEEVARTCPGQFRLEVLSQIAGTDRR